MTVRVLQGMEPVLLDREDPLLTDSERAAFFGIGTESVVIAPMILNGRATGIISFYSPQRHFFTADAIKLAMEFGSLAALAIDRAQTNKALSEQATRDGLTSVLNRRALNDWLDHQIALTDRNEDVFSILMIDLNDFKVINDTYGHLVGDNVLREVAIAVQNALRTSDLLGRYGGDEFLAILPSTDLIEAMSLAARLAETVCADPIRLAGGQEVFPSLSIGTAAYPVSARDREGMIEVADRAMYAVKQADLSGGAPEQSKLADAVGMSVAS